MKKHIPKNHSMRIFAVSGVLTTIALAATAYYMGLQAAFVAFVLILIEITFSFENAIINARVLSTMSMFWQRMFMTLGILIAVVGMRLVFPILVVMITAGLHADEVIRLALQEPEKYATRLHDAHVSIASFGGFFLLMLCLNFFFDDGRKIRWINIVERPLQRLSAWWVYSSISLLLLLAISFNPWNDHAMSTLTAGFTGIVTFLTIHSLSQLFTKNQQKRNGTVAAAGLAGFMSFIYLEILDASFSFDGVIGAFAVTKDVVLIAVGLGVGALWVRSLTLFMVRKHVLTAYRYLEHGAHYTIGILALVLLSGLFVDIPEVIAGVIGVIIVGLSIFSSIAENKLEAKHATNH